jgi:large repetitive protein
LSLQDIANAGDGNGGNVGNSEDNFDYLGGIYDFEVTNLPEAGSAVQIVIPQANAIGDFPEYRKFRPVTGWSKFIEDENNRVESAAGSLSACPDPGDAAYQPGLTAGHFCVQLTIEDGGPNDGDAAPNGIVRDPGGVATPKGEVRVGQGGGSIGLLALLVLTCVAWFGAFRRRPRARDDLSCPSTAGALCASLRPGSLHSRDR